MPDLAYFPSKRHVEKNLKGETALKPYDFVALSIAAKRAVREGVLPEELASKMIPMAMVEGHTGTTNGGYGIINLALYPKQETIDRFTKMGLTISRVADPMEGGVADHPPSDMIITKLPGKSGEFLMKNYGLPPEPMRQARMMAAMLSEKASLKGVASPEDAVKRYNGVGRATEIADGRAVPADTNVYLGKVQEAQEMLSHPANAPLKQLLQDIGAQ